MTWTGDAGTMTGNGAPRTPRYDRTIRAVMWLDAFWSVAFILAAVAAAVVAVAWTPSEVPAVLVAATFVSALVLAACGAVTGALLMVRMNEGHFYLPEDLRLPLPAFMRPDLRAPR